MSDECKCTLRGRLVGDGCSVCNPEMASDFAEPQGSRVIWCGKPAYPRLACECGHETALPISHDGPACCEECGQVYPAPEKTDQ